MLKKLKSYVLDDTIYIAILLILTSVLSFGLGKLSVIQSQSSDSGVVKPAIVRSVMGPVSSTTDNNIENQTVPTVATSAPTVLQIVSTDTQLQKNFVASKSGTKYHALNCSGFKTIKETNKIFFATESDAQAAGYTRSANCKFSEVLR